MPERHLGNELPRFRRMDELFYLVVDKGIIMLYIYTQSQISQGCPDGKLHHAVSLLGPNGEIIGIRRKLPGQVS